MKSSCVKIEPHCRIATISDHPPLALLAGARVRGGLERCLIRAQARFLVYLGARIPEQNLGGADQWPRGSAEVVG